MSGHKNTGHFPIRVRESPAKPQLQRRKEKCPARRKDTTAPCFFFIFGAKELFKTGRIACTFAETNDVKNSKS